MELWNGRWALLKDADSSVVWTHLHKREAFRGSKSHQHSRKPSNIHHCQAPSQVLKMTYETNNGQESNIWISKAFITFSPRRWKSRLQPNLKSKFTLFHLFWEKSSVSYSDKKVTHKPEGRHPGTSDRNSTSIDWGLNCWAGACPSKINMKM